MDWNYISGFFDADGSLTLTKNRRNEHRSLTISFSNNDDELLSRIQNFIFAYLGIRGVMIQKKPRKSTHKTNYELKYNTTPQCLEIIKRLNSQHIKKRYRMHLALTELPSLIKRNGKYTEKELIEKQEFEKRFFSTFP